MLTYAGHSHARATCDRDPCGLYAWGEKEQIRRKKKKKTGVHQWPRGVVNSEVNSRSKFSSKFSNSVTHSAQAQQEHVYFFYILL